MADEQFDPTAHTADEVKAHLADAQPDEFARVIAAERDRTDGKDPRVSVVNYTQTAGVVGPDGYTRVVVST